MELATSFARIALLVGSTALLKLARVRQ